MFKFILLYNFLKNGIDDFTEECRGYENGILGGVVSALNIFLF